jgi:hypothetical protein
MTDEELTPVEKILVSFFENPEDRKPDIKKLARLLRSGEPLPPGVSWMAEVLDSRLPGKLACNWRLRPVFAGRYDKTQRADKVDAFVVREINTARERGLTIATAIREIAGKIGKSESILRKIWDEHRRWERGPPEHLRKVMEKAAREFLDEAARKRGQDPA